MKHKGSGDRKTLCVCYQLQINDADSSKFTSERNETYVYDSKGIPLSSTEISSDGEKLLRKFHNGTIRSETRNDKNGMTFMVAEYDEAGLGKYVNHSGFEQFIEHDLNDNPILIKANSQSVLIYITTFVYDNKKNPETLISNFFKGVPVPMTMLRRSDGVNIVVKENYEDLNGSQSETNWSLTYNAINLPKQAKRIDTSHMTQTF